MAGSAPLHLLCRDGVIQGTQLGWDPEGVRGICGKSLAFLQEEFKGNKSCPGLSVPGVFFSCTTSKLCPR